MQIICSTSDRYLHLIPVFEYLYKKHWNDEITIIGYEKPITSLPFVSMGTQGDVKEWSTDLRKYIESIDDEWICWIMEDTIVKSFYHGQFDATCSLMMPGVGRIGLTNDIQKREHTVTPGGIVYAHPNSRYRLSTQPSIWNKTFLLQYLTNGLTPWEFETQDPKNDGWQIVSLETPPLKHNEGVRRQDRFKLDLNGVPDEDIKHLKSIASWI